MARQLPENVEKLFRVFKAAVEDERRAQAMYKEAIGLCDDEVTRKDSCRARRDKNPWW